MFGFSFVKIKPTDYVLVYKKGKIVKEGSGLSFFYYSPTTSLALVPMGSVDAPYIFEELTLDFQAITVQGQVTYRIAEPKKIAQFLNYTLSNKGQTYVSDDHHKLPQRVINIVSVLTKKHLERMKLKESLKSTEVLAEIINKEIKANEEIHILGIEVLGLSILAILPNKETSRALEAEAREDILRQADGAIYERRNASVEEERRIKENELNTEIAVENKKRQIKETQMEAERIVQQKQHELKEAEMNFRIEMEEKKKALVELSVANAKAQADAKAYEVSAIMKALEGVNPNVIKSLATIGMEPNKLIAVAFQELAEKAEKIGQLNISPDLLQELLKKEDK